MVQCYTGGKVVADSNAVSMLACYVHGNGDDNINTNFSPFCYNSISMPEWRNWLAHQTSNLGVAGSSE